MVISIFTPPEEGREWNECKTGDICDCLTFEYEKFFNGVGTFTLELPITTRFRDKLLVGSVLVTSDGDALIVKNIQTTLDKVKVTGYDLNGLLADRITLATDTDGTDPVEGTTEYCVKHYVESNLYACATDPNRNLPRFGIAANQDRGDPTDNNMPRYAKVHDVVTEMCGAAKLGWRVALNNSAGSSNPVFVFDVSEQVDKSVNQTERNRVILSVQQHNVSGMTREVGVTAERNALYLDIDGTVVGYPQADDKSGRTVAAGYSRREEYCALSGNSLDFDKYKVEAEQNIADRMAETDSLTIEAGSPMDYRSIYDVGDIVTVYDRERSLQLDSVISAVTVRRTADEYSVKLTLGESKPKLLDQYAKKGEVVGRTVRNEATTIYNGVGMKSPLDSTSEIFNCYDGNNTAGAKGTSYYATTRGYKNAATVYCSSASGYNTVASGYCSHAEGASSQATGSDSHAEGNYTHATGSESHTEGYNTSASGSNTHAEGSGTKAAKDCDHAEGLSTEASGGKSHAEGSNTKALAYGSHAEGAYSQAQGYSSHAEGCYTVASGYESHAEGEHSTASGYISHVGGYGCVASGAYSFAGGSNSEASADASFAHGQNLKTPEGNYGMNWAGAIKIRAIVSGSFSPWVSVADGGNAASVGAYTEAKIAALEARIAALEGGTA